MKNKRNWILLAGLALLAAAFLLLNFRAAVSNTRADSTASTASMGEQLPDAMQRREKITMVVTGEGPLAGMLRKSLAAEIRKAGLGEVELAQELAANYQNPVMLVKTGQPEVIWTPFFGTSRLTVNAGYASNGNTARMMQKETVFDNRDGPTLYMSGEYKVSDSSWGILTRPGYYQYLADYLARTIVDATKKLYEPKL